MDFVLLNLGLNLNCGYILAVNRAETEMNHLSLEIFILTLLLEMLACVLRLEQFCFDLSSNPWYWTLKGKKNIMWFKWAFHLQKKRLCVELSIPIIISCYFSAKIYTIILWPQNFSTFASFSAKHICFNFLNLRMYSLVIYHSFAYLEILEEETIMWNDDTPNFVVTIKTELGKETGLRLHG
jgi:hypothetical protein